eukprot:12412041-Karenia_brevis.AAC.1
MLCTIQRASLTQDGCCTADHRSTFLLPMRVSASSVLQRSSSTMTSRVGPPASRLQRTMKSGTNPCLLRSG